MGDPEDAMACLVLVSTLSIPVVLLIYRVRVQQLFEYDSPTGRFISVAVFAAISLAALVHLVWRYLDPKDHIQLAGVGLIGWSTLMVSIFFWARCIHLVAGGREHRD